ncbi:MAG: NAD-dependent epimerase/dehydratase family protein [Opitutales bacterium]|nr:NAD-dependent epimerase/dehydratase family protein [Opitutales bacterium]
MSGRGRTAPRLLVFGCGYVGGAVVEASLAGGWEVTIVSRSAERMARFAGHPRAAAVAADLATDTWHRRVPTAVDLAVNCVSGGGGSPQDYRRAYVEGMRSIAAWAGSAPPRTFVYTSSTGVYPQSGGETVSEEDAASMDNASPRQRILLEAEALARRVPAECRVVLRLAGIYGPGRHYLLDRLVDGVRVFEGTGNFYLNLIHREDALAAILAAYAASLPPGAHTFNVADGHAATKAEIAAWLAARLKTPPPVFDPSRPSPRALRRLGPGGAPPHRLVDPSAFKAATGWQPAYPSFEDGYLPILDMVRRC